MSAGLAGNRTSHASAACAIAVIETLSFLTRISGLNMVGSLGLAAQSGCAHVDESTEKSSSPMLSADLLARYPSCILDIGFKPSLRYFRAPLTEPIVDEMLTICAVQYDHDLGHCRGFEHRYGGSQCATYCSTKIDSRSDCKEMLQTCFLVPFLMRGRRCWVTKRGPTTFVIRMSFSSPASLQTAEHNKEVDSHPLCPRTGIPGNTALCKFLGSQLCRGM